MSNTGLKRVSKLEKYYTKKEVVNLCFEFIKRELKNIEGEIFILEPSAGGGAFIDIIKSITKYYNFIDIEPEHEDIIKQDYLSLDDKIKVIKDNKIKTMLIVGNPPFGRQSSLAIKFINKSCNILENTYNEIENGFICFILPKSFKKDSMKNKFSTYFHLIFEYDLNNSNIEKCFYVGNEEHSVPCVFQIWKKSNIKRKEKKIENPINFKFIQKSDLSSLDFIRENLEDTYISVRRVGVNSGVIKENLEDIINSDLSIQSNYFIKFNSSEDKQKIIQNKKNIEFKHNNTVAAKSISKPELIEMFNKFMNLELNNL